MAKKLPKGPHILIICLDEEEYEKCLLERKVPDNIILQFKVNHKKYLYCGIHFANVFIEEIVLYGNWRERIDLPIIEETIQQYTKFHNFSLKK